MIGLDTSASNAIETVIENSGAWGGAGLPISAGPGIKVGLENGVLMISNDETLLWSGSAYSTGTDYQLTEPISNFKRIKTVTRPERGATRTEQISEFHFTDIMPESNDLNWYTVSRTTNDQFLEEIWSMRYTNSGNSFNLQKGIRKYGTYSPSVVTTYSGALVEIYGLDRR